MSFSVCDYVDQVDYDVLPLDVCGFIFGEAMAIQSQCYTYREDQHIHICA